MKKFTRILCLVLCLATLAPCLAACEPKDPTSGAQINMYLASEVYNFDPAYAHLDSSATKLLGLLFEGIMKLDDDGDVKKSLCDSWDYKEDEGIDPEDPADNKYTMTIKLKKSAWSDGRALSADDFVFAWKRLLEPDFDGEGAELLYDIVGAWERKNVGYSPDDIGLYADQQVLTIEFKHSIDPDDFLRKLASVALFPVRRDCVDHYYHWSSANTTIITNGPFTVLAYFPGSNMELGRNTYYRHDTSEDEDPTPYKHVTPYKLIVNFQQNAEELMESYNNGTLFYIGEIPAVKSIREEWKSKVDLSDSLCSHVYYFNTNKEPFNNPVVRQVLSSVISRQEIANEVVYATASTGFVPAGIKDKTKKDDFAENNANKIVDSMAISEAKSKLQAAGINPSDFSFELTVKVNTDSNVNEANGAPNIKSISNSNERIYNTVDYVIAQMVVAKWNELGFNVTLKPVNTVAYQEETSMLWQFRDTALESLYGTYGDGITVYKGTDEETNETITEQVKVERASFDVVALDYQLLDASAFSALSVFAANYSGAVLDENFNTLGHVTGYNSEAYNKLIEEADKARIAGDKETMSAKLHEAEALLLTDCPVTPIIVYQNAVLSSNKLSGFKISGWGYPEFNKLKLKDWQNYLPGGSEEE